MKKFLIVLLMAGLLLLTAAPSPAFAQARYGLQTTAAIETSTALILPAGTWVYGISIFADEASSVMGVYDSADLEGATATTVKDEIGEATQYDTAVRMGSPYPLYFTNGVTVTIGTGVGFVHYGPQP